MANETTAVPVPHGISYANNRGEAGVLSGKLEPNLIDLNAPFGMAMSWVKRPHPLRTIWINDELKSRASYLATRQHLGPFLVPHRFEGTRVQPHNLPRAHLGYGIGLNKAYLAEVFGHIRSTPAHYTWGPMSTDRKEITKPPAGQAEMFWYDATGDGLSLTNFIEGRVLEWIATSPGGFILIDSNRPPGVSLSQADAARFGIRSSLRWIPFSWVVDYRRGKRGFEWVKIAETEDTRGPKEDADSIKKRYLLYELGPTGLTIITRWDEDGNQIGSGVVQEFRDVDGHGILPLVESNFGEHPDVEGLGTGMLMGLDDIVLDLWNVMSEVREAYRGSVFTFHTYLGDDYQGIHGQMESGTRLVNIGTMPHAKLQRDSADATEVETGLKLIEMGLKNWSLSAKRRAMEVMEASSARSGVSLKSEFQLDLRPVLVTLTETLDEIETNALFLLAQMEGFSASEANAVVVKRETEFNLEQEASRISRLAAEFLQAIPVLPQSVMEKLIVRWAESLDFLKLDDDGLREKVIEEAKEIAESEQKSRILQNDFGAMGALANPERRGAENANNTPPPPPTGTGADE